MRVSRVGVGVNSECLESVVDMCGDDDTSDHCLLGQEKLDMSGRGARREDILQPRSLQDISILLSTGQLEQILKISCVTTLGLMARARTATVK